MKKAASAATLTARTHEILRGNYTMDEKNFQDDLEIIDEEEAVDFFDDSPYYHHPAYPEFNGWRDMLV